LFGGKYLQYQIKLLDWWRWWRWSVI